MPGTRRSHERWLQTLVQRPLIQKWAGLETTPIAQERPRETRRGPGLACSRSLGQEVSCWDVSPETTGHRAFAKRDKSPRGKQKSLGSLLHALQAALYPQSRQRPHWQAPPRVAGPLSRPGSPDMAGGSCRTRSGSRL